MPSYGGAQNVRDQISYQQNRYEGQQGPLANSMGFNYGRGTEADYGNYTDIMNNYRDIYSGAGSSSSGGGGGGGGGGAASNYSAFTVNPERVNAERANVRSLGPLERVQAQKLNPLQKVQQSNPFQSYAGFQEFGRTGGYSPQDIANMRARGTSPIRAAYGNAERNIGQQRSLQGGYSPNAIAAQVKMAREQGQGMADASQNVEAGIAEARNRGRLSGYEGMSNIERAQLDAQMQGDMFNSSEARQGNQFDLSNQFEADKYNAGQAFQGQQFDIGNEMNTSQFNAGQGNQVGQFNAELGMKGQMYNADAMTQAQARNNASAEAGASRAAASAAASQQDRLRALQGASQLYGTTPGMSNMFGQQVSNIVGQGGNMGMGYINATAGAEGMPGNFDMTMNRVQQASNMAAPWVDYFGGGNQNNQQPQYGGGGGGGQQNNGGYYAGYGFGGNQIQVDEYGNPIYE